MDLKTLCALFMGGSLGVGGTVAVQEVKAPKPAVVSHKRATKPVVARKAPITRHKPAALSSSLLSDCPLPSAVIGPVGGVPSLSTSYHPVGPFSPLPLEPDHWWYGGGALPPVAPPPTDPGIPEPATWMFLVSGFGLVGLSLRRRAVA